MTPQTEQAIKDAEAWLSMTGKREDPQTKLIRSLHEALKQELLDNAALRKGIAEAWIAQREAMIRSKVLILMEDDGR